jgi:hypothetical protein
MSDIKTWTKGDIVSELVIKGSSIKLLGRVPSPAKSDVHKTVYVDLLPLPDQLISSSIMRIYFDICGSNELAGAFAVFIINEAGGIDKKVQINVDTTNTRIVFDLVVPISSGRLKMGFYQDRTQAVSFEVKNIGLICNSGIYKLTNAAWRQLSSRIERQWKQSGRKCILKTTCGDFYAKMPTGWKLSDIPQESLQVAEHFLLSPIEANLFNVDPYEVLAEHPNSSEVFNRQIGDRDLLAFSVGTDSTAACLLLPDETIRFFCKRDYNSYKKSTGHVVALQDFTPLQRALDQTVSVVVPNNFELIGIAYGYNHGYRHNFGYVAIGVLLGKLLNARSVSFGSVMEQVFMGSGNNYLDVGLLKSSRANQMKKMLAIVGLDLCLPTSACSEVVTNHIVRNSHLKDYAVSCPKADEMGNSCGVCFKCFRKLRLDGIVVPEPSESVKYVLSKYPLKSATSVMFAVKKSGYRSEITDRYLHINLDFLERYHGYAINTFVPEYLRSHIENKLAEYGVLPMTQDDEIKLRNIGRHFWPEKFDPKRAGLTV